MKEENIQYWVYLGQGTGKGVPVVERFQAIDENQTWIGKSFAFKKFKRALLPGGIYQISGYNGSSVAEQDVVFTGKVIADQEWLLEIRTDHEVFKAKKKLQALETKFKSEYKMSNDLNQLAQAYRSLWGVDRLVFEHLVIARLRELAGKA